MKTKSSIFTDAEYKALVERMKGSKKDDFGLISSRVKPKVKEILAWFPKKDNLEKLF